MKESLFIGGKSNGERRRVPLEYPYYKVAFKEGFSEISIEIYRRIRFICGRQEFDIFALDSISDEVTFQMLLDGYCPKPEQA